jgi:hypothetical protein
MKEFAVYTLARIGLFVASLAIVLGVWALVAGSVNALLAVLLAAVISAVASYYLLQGPRARFASRVDSRASRIAAKFEEARSKEDRD